MNTQTLFELNATELAAAATTLPLALVKQNGQWGLYAVAGLEPNHNLLIQNNQWIGNYTPYSAGRVSNNPAAQKMHLLKTHTAVQALVDAGVVVPWPEALRAQVGMQIDGLHCIDEAALAQLAPADFLLLRHHQALGIAYGVNLALQQCHILVRLARLGGQQAMSADSAASADALFGEGQDDTLRFDF